MRDTCKRARRLSMRRAGPLRHVWLLLPLSAIAGDKLFCVRKWVSEECGQCDRCARGEPTVQRNGLTQDHAGRVVVYNIISI